MDYQSTLNSLESGHLGGLGIDVAWSEPFDPNDPILQFDNVISSPHIAGVTKHSYRSMAKVFYQYCFLILLTSVLFIVSVANTLFKLFHEIRLVNIECWRSSLVYCQHKQNKGEKYNLVPSVCHFTTLSLIF